jgi:DNA polymerase-3 subunit delta'
VSAPYPWLAGVWQQLLAGKARPAHALLIAGPPGVGKSALARAWARALLCETAGPDGDACGSCQACHWFDAGTHPDFRVVSLQEKENKDGESVLANEIDVEQARATVDFVQVSTYRAGRRVVLVEPAAALNLAAANALLKVLEEPPLNTTFVLVADRARRLLPTIRSRCVQLDIGLPPRAAALDWLHAQGGADADNLLALAGGAPLAVAAWRDGDALRQRRELLQALSLPQGLDPLTQAAAWKSVPAPIWHNLAYRWLADVLAAALAVRSSARFNPDFGPALDAIGRQADVARLLALCKTHAGQGRHVLHPLNRQLQMETWLAEYRRIFRRAE